MSLAALVAAGCGGQGTKLKGKVLKNGQPYQIGSDESFSLLFSQPGANFMAAAMVSPDGTFILDGPANKGVPPGKYQIKVASRPSDYAKPGTPQGDKFKDKYSDAAKSPLSVEITSSTKEVTVDVGTGSASAT